jgi:hypothetical protein
MGAGPESGHEFAVLLVDRTSAAKVVAVLVIFQQPFTGHILARVTFSRNGITSSRHSGPPKDTSNRASNGLDITDFFMD